MNKFQYKVQGVDYDVEIEEMEGNVAKVLVNGIRFEVELKQPINPAHATRKRHDMVQPTQAAQQQALATPQPAATGGASQPAAQPAAAGSGSQVKSPLPGTITTVCVKVGDKVNMGDTVVVLEAMKMQNNIESEFAGTVTSVMVNTGDSVLEGAVLITIA